MSKKVEKLEEKLASAKIYTEFIGNYTVVEASLAGKRAFGIAKRNPGADEYIPERGEQIARVRALRNLSAKLRKK